MPAESDPPPAFSEDLASSLCEGTMMRERVRRWGSPGQPGCLSLAEFNAARLGAVLKRCERARAGHPPAEPGVAISSEHDQGFLSEMLKYRARITGPIHAHRLRGTSEGFLGATWNSTIVSDAPSYRPSKVALSTSIRLNGLEPLGRPTPGERDTGHRSEDDTV